MISLQKWKMISFKKKTSNEGVSSIPPTIWSMCVKISMISNATCLREVSQTYNFRHVNNGWDWLGATTRNKGKNSARDISYRAFFSKNRRYSNVISIYLYSSYIINEYNVKWVFRKSINDHLLFNSFLHLNKSEIQYYNLLMINTVMFFVFMLRK